MASEDSVIIATGDMLREATRVGKEGRPASQEERNAEWLAWVDKRMVRMLKDACSFGRSSVTLDVPYQPTTKEDERGLVALRRQLRRLLPGCEIHFYEEKDEETDQSVCTMIISW
jgi:hypothetical protein